MTKQMNDMLFQLMTCSVEAIKNGVTLGVLSRDAHDFLAASCDRWEVQPRAGQKFIVFTGVRSDGRTWEIATPMKTT